MVRKRKSESVAIHPSRRFVAPAAIETGKPLKTLIGRELVGLIGESIQNVSSGFSLREFTVAAVRGLDKLELKGRAQHIAVALRLFLPEDFGDALEILTASLGPTLSETEGNGLAPFFYLPHSEFIAFYGLEHFELGMQANLELTQRFSAEFSIRPFIERYPEKSLKLLRKWSRHASPHVRRLVSEGSRPRLPWGMRLKVFSSAPEKTLALLELLKDDPELYVRRSVANHLGDLLKDHPELVYETCRSWIAEVSARKIPRETRSARFWMIRHAVRLPAKKNNPEALEIRRLAKS